MEPTDPLSFEDRLLAVQTKLKAPKDKLNDFAKYKYRKAEDILENAKPLLSEHGLLLTISDEIMDVGGRIYVRAAATVSHGEHHLTVTAYAREEETKKGLDAAQITGSASSYSRKYALSGLFLLDDSEADPDTNEYHKQTHQPRNGIASETYGEPDKWGPGTGGGPDRDVDAPVSPRIAPGRTKPSQSSDSMSTPVPHAQKPITMQQTRQLFALGTEIAQQRDWPKDWFRADLFAHFAVDSSSKMTMAQAEHAIRALYAVKDKGAVFADALQQQKGA